MRNLKYNKIKRLVNLFYSRNIESLPYKHWFNPVQTLYLNFRSFPFKQACHLPIKVYGRVRIFSLAGNMQCVGECRRFMIELNKTNVGMPGYPGGNTVIKNDGTILFHGKCQIYTDNKINVRAGAVMELGNGVRIMSSVNIGVFSRLNIGEYTWIVHRCQIMDTNYHYIADFTSGKIKRPTNPIEIGNYCWVCNSTTITGGSILPDKTIVASNSLVNRDMRDIPEESMVGGQPAKLLATGFRRVDNSQFIQELDTWFRDHPEETTFDIPSCDDHSICDVLDL